MNEYTLESFINYCDEMQIANEGYTVHCDCGEYYVETNVNKIEIVISEEYNYTDDPKEYNKRLNNVMTKVVKVVKSTYKDIIDVASSYLKFEWVNYLFWYKKIQDYKNFKPKIKMRIDAVLEYIEEDGILDLTFCFDRSMKDILGSYNGLTQGYGLSYNMNNPGKGWYSIETDSPKFKKFREDPSKYINDLVSRSNVSYEDICKNFIKDFNILIKEYNIKPGPKTYQIQNELIEGEPIILFKEYDEDYSETGGDYDNGLTKKDKKDSDKCAKALYSICDKLKNKYNVDIDAYRGHGTIYLEK